MINRPAPGAGTFVDAAEPYRYWKQIVDELRTYARDRYGREILISTNWIGVTDQAAPRRRLVHVVNHDYSAGLIAHQNVSVTVPSDARRRRPPP